MKFRRKISSSFQDKGWVSDLLVILSVHTASVAATVGIVFMAS